MKRLFLPLLILCGILIPGTKSFASHGMGGEITWTCLPGGQFRFQMKFYRDCNGIPGPASVTMNTTVPGVPTILLNLFQQNDISPDGIAANGITACPNCINGNAGNPIPGLVEEFIYQSAPINLPGVPPAAGWTFSWGECCRSNLINNITGAGGIGFMNRAIMYPYLGTNTLPCFDSSPYFAEKPSTIICTGYPFKYNPNAVDPELDSLVYSWGQPLTDAGTPAPFAPGYSINSQLPSTIQNPANIAATIDPVSGEVSYLSYTGGYFATVVKVTAYKCNVKVAEIFREINVVLNNNCPTIAGGVPNTPPDVNPPFFNPVTGLQTEYHDTVYAGDTVNFMLAITDFETFVNGTPQTIKIEGSGAQFGANFTNPNAGCILPPCATTTPGLPNFFPIGGNVTFNWVTTCQHVEGLDTNCTRISNTYTFVIKASDNYCPANASNVSTFTITILQPPKLDPPVLRCASVNLDGSVSLNWTKPTPVDTQNTFYSYEIYASLAAGGPWTLVDSVMSGYLLPASYSYTHSLADLTTLFGTNAQQQSIYYHIKTASGCSGDSLSNPSNVLRTIKLDGVPNGANQVVLNWNALSTPPLSSHVNNKYMIYKEYPMGTWMLIDSTALLTYTDVTTASLCNATIVYRVELDDSSGCTSVSSLDTVILNNTAPVVTFSPANPAHCTGGCVTITCTNNGMSYLWSTGEVTQSINYCGAGPVTVTISNGLCINSGSIPVTVNPLPTPVITGDNVICADETTVFDASTGGPYISYLWGPNGEVTPTISPASSGIYTVTVTDINGCSNTTTQTLTINPLPTPNITTADSTICIGTNTILNAGAGYNSYLWSAGAQVTPTISVGTAGNYTVTVTNAFLCSATDVINVVVNPLPTPNIIGDNSICAGQTTTFDASNPNYVGYLWSNGFPTPTITVGTANLYSVMVTDINGCTNTDDITLTVNPNPVPVITGVNQICDGQTTVFDAGTAPGGYTYNWNNGTWATQTITIGLAGPYTVTVTDINGCTGTASNNLIVHPNPVPVITGDTEICQGLTTVLDAGPGYVAYQWSNGGPATQTMTTGTAGSYTVTVTAPFTGCIGTASTSLIVNPLPTPNIIGDNSICAGFTTTFDATNPNYVSYLWSNGFPTPTITVGTANLYSVMVTDINGCTNTDDITLTVNPNPVPVITGTPTTCQGMTTVIDAGTAPGGYTYNWSTGATTQTINIGIAGPVTVTVTDINGCIGIDDMMITVYDLPTAAMSGIDTVCAGQGTTIQVNFTGTGPYEYSYSDGVTTYGPFPSGVAAINIPVTPPATTTYTLVNVSNVNCVGTVGGTANISVTPLPTAVLTGTDDICDGENTNISINFTGVGPYTYSYTAGATVYGPFTTTNDPEIINVAPVLTTTYGLTATVVGFGCTGNTDPATAIVTVHPLPTATIAGDNEICAGEQTDLTLNFVGTGPFTYTYSNGAVNYGPFTTPNNPVTVTITPPATATYSLVTIGDANCVGSVAGTAEITVNPLPTAVMSGTASICDGTDTDLSILFTGTGPYTYSYTDGTNVFGPFGTSQNPVSITVAPVVNTTYTVTTVGDAHCANNGTGAAAITIIPLPTSSLTGSTEICEGSSTNMVLSFTGVPPFEYNYWDGSNTYGPFTTNNFSTNINVAPLVNTSYNISYLTGNGCTGTPAGVVDIVVNIIPDATIALTGDDILCAGESSEFMINFVGIAPYTYSYSDGTTTYGPFTTSLNPEIIPVTPSANANYTLITFSDDKCNGTMTGAVPVTVHPLPTATVSGNPEICNGSSTSFTVGFTGTGPFTYSYFDGSLNHGPFVTSNNPESIQVAPTVNTSYNVVTVSDVNCVGSASGVANVTVNEIPSASISGDATICFGDVTTLSVLFNGVAPFSYTYHNGNNNVGPFTASGNPESIPVSPGATTTFTLVSISDANCPGTLAGTADVVVNPLPQPVISGDFEICDGESSTLFAPPGYNAYSWSNGSSAQAIVVTTPDIFTVSVTDVNGCVGTSPAINFLVNQTPVVSFTNDTSLTCEIPEVNFFNTSSYPSGSAFLWNFGDNSTSTLANPSHVYELPGNYNVSLIITTQDACVSTHVQPVEIMFYPLPVAKFTPTPEVTNIFNSRVDFTDQSQYAVSWLWDMGDGSKLTDQNPYYYFNDIGEYKVILTVTNIAGCVDQYEDVIVVNPFYIPNAFTPNADGINDNFFEAGYVLDVQSYKMIIFNRWGERVYEGDDYTKFWNGFDSSGNPAQQGVYVYTINVTTKGGKEHQFSGTVSLIR